jgi:hypothetical protein
MEFGAALGFHGFGPATDAFRMESETLSASRVVTALILEYAAQMKTRGFGLVVDARAPALPAALGHELDGRRSANLNGGQLGHQGALCGDGRQGYRPPMQLRQLALYPPEGRETHCKDARTNRTVNQWSPSLSRTQSRN